MATPLFAAPQHGPRPLPLFLDMLRSETAANPDLRAAALQGLRLFQSAARQPPPAPLPASFEEGRARLRLAGPGASGGTPVVFVPSLINPPSILNLSEHQSIVRWFAAQGHPTWLLDWGEPDPAERDLGLAAHVERLLVPLLGRLSAPPILVGYCLGGTLAVAAAALTPVAGLAMIAAPWRFSGYGKQARTAIGDMWRAAQPTCEALGLVPMELLQTGFWRLDPARTVAKYAAFARLEPGSEAQQGFIRLEDWANAGAPLTYAAGRDLFEMLLRDDAPGRGAWCVGGTIVDPHALTCPTAEFVSLTDRIVPAASAAGLPRRYDLAAGHVGMVVGGRAKSQLWQPLAEWIISMDE